MIQRGVIVVLLFILVTVLIQASLQRAEIRKLRKKTISQGLLLKVYVDQMTPLQKVQNNIAVDDLESGVYVLDVWKNYKNYWGE